ncbi:hypothetical protein MKZ38_010503 [Zalerion maritima]|uniref:Uncharacterized protein n=1 Tax=Zalerion maritima TaxID=339359 RepID=A0AAD5WMW0_9PEZI|nr:hypothetical protein MKZ38_010503 [Zalerion maritima]
MSSGKITDARIEQLKGLQGHYKEIKEKKMEEQKKLEEKKKEWEALEEQLGELSNMINIEEEQLMAAATRTSLENREMETPIASFQMELDQLQGQITMKQEEIDVQLLVIKRIDEQIENAEEEIEVLQ